MERKRVGLALSSGGARGVAHIGVIAVLERKGIPIDMVAGASIGAIIGAFYAANKDSSQIADLIMNVGRREMRSLFDFTLPRRGLIKGERVKDWLKSIIGDIDFQDLKIPFACIATDINTGEEVVIKQGSVVEAVRASVSIPILFNPARWQGRYLVDGGLVDPVPVKALGEMGADFVIAASVSPYMAKKIPKVSINGLDRPKEPNIFNILRRMINTVTGEITISDLAEADIIITPDVTRRFRPGDVNRARELILRGERAAQRAIPEIKRQLEA